MFWFKNIIIGFFDFILYVDFRVNYIFIVIIVINFLGFLFGLFYFFIVLKFKFIV